MLNSIWLRIIQRFHPESLNNNYKNIVKLEWLAIFGLLIWLTIVFSTILN
jgi:hypothetical protein